MSYTPDEEILQPTIDKLLEGIRTFNEISEARIRSSNWNETHILELHDLRKDLLDVQLKLYKLI